jgi:hypothetical protein
MSHEVAGLCSVTLSVNVMCKIRVVTRHRSIAGQKREASDDGNILNDRSGKCFFITGADKAPYL